MRSLCVLFVAFAIFSVFSASAQSGRIRGSVQQEDGTPVANARVQVLRATAPPFNVEVKTGDDGSFDAEGLPAGTYRICPDPPSGQHLSPCLWHDPSAIVTVQDGQVVDGTTIVMKLGTTVTVVVKDPVGLLQKKHVKTDPMQMLFVAVKGPKKIPYPLAAGVQQGSRTVYQMTVPFDTALKLIVLPIGLAATNDSGNAIPDKGQVLDFAQPRNQKAKLGGQQPLSFEFTINDKHN